MIEIDWIEAAAGGGYGPNFLTGGTASAGSTYAGYVPANAVDGNGGTHWISSGVAPDWWKYDLGAGVAKTARKLVLQSVDTGDGGRANAFVLAGSNDNSSWTTILSANLANSDAAQAFEFANSTAWRYHRVTVNSTHAGTGNSPTLTEVQAMEAA